MPSGVHEGAVSHIVGGPVSGRKISDINSPTIYFGYPKKLERAIRYLGIKVDDVLEISEKRNLNFEA
tara:strand:- start:3307 stop:3507 length:201 start_codon:yes stop_codon:yes gene_type:complete